MPTEGRNGVGTGTQLVLCKTTSCVPVPTPLNDYMPQPGDSYLLFSSGQLSGAFNQFVLPTLPNGEQWHTGNLDANGTISVVPEPGTLVLLVAAVVGLVGWAGRGRAGRKRAENERQDDAPASLCYRSAIPRRPDLARRAA